jgi:bacterioferritin-associated ferredoxin
MKRWPERQRISGEPSLPSSNPSHWAVSMIICSCNVLSDHEVRTAIATGAPPRTTGEFFRYFGCIAQCGRCARSIKEIMDEPPSAPSGQPLLMRRR